MLLMLHLKKKSKLWREKKKTALPIIIRHNAFGWFPFTPLPPFPLPQPLKSVAVVFHLHVKCKICIAKVFPGSVMGDHSLPNPLPSSSFTAQPPWGDHQRRCSISCLWDQCSSQQEGVCHGNIQKQARHEKAGKLARVTTNAVFCTWQTLVYASM